MKINTNVNSLISQGSLFANGQNLSKSLEKLSTGLRINRAGDDAAGLGISEGLRSQIRGQEQAKRNTLDGISALNIVDSSLNEIHAIMQRQRELAVQSANGTYSSTERGYINQEFAALNNEIDRIVSATNFNGIKLLTGTDFNGKSLQVDANNTAADRITITYGAISKASGDLSTDTGSQSAIDALDTAIKSVSTSRADVGVLVNRLTHTVSNLDNSIANQSAAQSQIRDVDMAKVAADFTKQQIIQQSAMAALANANSNQQSILSLLR